MEIDVVALSLPTPLALSPPAVVAPAVTSDEAHEKMMLTSGELAELCQEPLTDTGLARIHRLIDQMGTAFNQTVASRQLEGDSAVA